jgi:CHAT domain-containing protein
VSGLCGIRALEHELARRTLATPLPPVVADAVRLAAGGAYRAALGALDGPALAVRDGNDLLVAGWRRLATDARWLALPDGSGRAQSALGEDDQRPLEGQPDWAEATARARPGRLTAMARLVGTSVPESRGWLSLLPPCSRLSPLTPEVLERALAMLVAARQLAEQVDAPLVARVDLLAAEFLRRGGQPQPALSLLQQLVGRSEQEGDEELRADCLTLWGDWLAAPLSAPVVWNCAMQESVSPDSAIDDDIERLELLDGRPRLDEAIAVYAQARERYTATGDPMGLAQLDLRAIWTAVAGGRADDAVQAGERASRSLVAAGDRLGAANAAVQTALAALAAGRLPEDHEGVEAATRWAVEQAGQGPAAGLGLLLSRVGRRWAAAGADLEAALGASRLAATAFGIAGLAPRVAQARADQARVLLELGDATAARIVLEDLLDGEMPEAAAQGAPTLALQNRLLLLAQLYNACSNDRDVDGMAAASRRFHDLLERLAPALAAGADGTAEPMLAELSGLVPREDEDAAALLYRVRAAREAGDAAAEQDLLDRVERLLPQLPDRYRQLIDALVAVLRRDPGRAAAAVRSYLDASSRATAELARQLPVDRSDSERLLLQQRRQLHAQALSVLVRARAWRDAEEHLSALRSLASPWWAGLARSWEAAALEGRLQEVAGRLEESLAAYDGGVRDVEASRAGLRRDSYKTEFSASVNVLDLYRGAARSAARGWRVTRGQRGRAYGAAAMDYLERGRARALLDLLEGNLRGARGLPAELVRSWREADAAAATARSRLLHADASGAPAGRVDHWRAELRSAEAALDRAEAELQRHDPAAWRTANPQADVVELTDLTAAMPTGSVLLQYSIDDPELVAVAIGPDGVVAAHWSDDQHGLTARCRRLVRGCIDGGETTEVARRLADILLAPLGDGIAGAERVIVVGSGPTLRIPWGLLPWDGAPLLERRAVTALPSASVLPLLRRSADLSAGPPLVVGDPAAMAMQNPQTGEVRPQPALPAAAVEAAWVAGRVAGSRLLVGAAATEAEVRALLPQARIVHLATHGWLDEAAPLASCVLLASGTSLTVAELAGLSLSADLVVLSACHTGAGAANGDDLVGLARGLLVAGAREALVTLWAVNDVSTALLMGRFYDGLARNLPAADALRAAQLWLRGLSRAEGREAYERLHGELAQAAAGLSPTDRTADALRTVRISGRSSVGYEHPRHWAPFVLIGA